MGGIIDADHANMLHMYSTQIKSYDRLLIL